MRRRCSPLSVAAFALAASIPALAQVTPTAPGPGDSYRVGGNCIAEWDIDTTGTWDSFDIDLMSGSNTAMTVVTRVADSMDGTSGVGTFTFTCPAVTPNSAIYFLQFTQDGADPQWTTRFTIASSTGATTTPTESTQANGTAILWGNGELADGTVASTVSVALSVTSSSPSSSSSSTSRMVTSTSSSSSASRTGSANAASKTSSGAKSSSTAAQTSTKMFYESWPLGGKIGLLAGVIVAGLVIFAILVFFCIRLIRRGKSNRRKKKSGAIALSSPSQAALTKSTDDDLDFKDEQDSYYKPSNESMADLHAAGGRGPYVAPGQAFSHNQAPAYNDDGKLRRESVWVAPEENRAGMGVGSGRGASPWRRPSSDLAGGFQAPAFDARYSPHSQSRGATGAEAYPLISPSAGHRPMSVTEVDGYTPTGSGVHEGGYQGGYQWSTQVRDAQQAESDWIKAHQAKR